MPAKHDSHSHAVPLWGLFLALLALTAAEVALFELWHYTYRQGAPFIPKYVMVLILIIVLTLPKAAIVLVYFMHIKFERFFIVFLALVPLVFASLAVLPTLTDVVTLRDHGYTHVQGLRDYKAHQKAGSAASVTPATAPQPEAPGPGGY
jgi:hypothetical protein